MLILRSTMSVALHAPPTIFSTRHVPSWLLLAFGAGAVNAGAFLACERFVSHVTGTVTRIGMDAGWALMLDYGLVLAFFVAGAMASVPLLEGRLRRGKEPLYALPLIAVSVILAAIAVAGRLGAFGAFGQSVEQPADFALLAALGFAMGLQNAAVSTSTGLAVRTTHMTGPATDLGIHLATSFYVSGEARRAALRGAALRGGKIAAFILGAALMVPVTRAAGYLAFVLPAAIVLIAAAQSFVPSRVRPLSPAAAAT